MKEDRDKQNADATLHCMSGRVQTGHDWSIYVLLLELNKRKRGIFRRIWVACGWGKVVKQKVLAGSSGEEEALQKNSLIGLCSGSFVR